VDSAKRWQLLRQAETILIRDEVPITPLYFEKGILFFDPKKVGGLHGNLVDQHPLSAMYRKDRPTAKAD
jgi:oligopeptide transport system substrate-binding protein